VFFGVILIMIVGIIAVAWDHHRKAADYNASGSSAATSSSSTDKTPSRSSTSSTLAQGGGVDTKGSSTPSTPTSSAVSSSSGLITVYSPTSGSKLSSGDAVSGTAKVGTVYYRIVDNSVGVISQGSLSVVNHKFSGNVYFHPHASTGQLDVFSYDSQGAEVNSVQINLSLGN